MASPLEPLAVCLKETCAVCVVPFCACITYLGVPLKHSMCKAVNFLMGRRLYLVPKWKFWAPSFCSSLLKMVDDVSLWLLKLGAANWARLSKFSPIFWVSLFFQDCCVSPWSDGRTGGFRLSLVWLSGSFTAAACWWWDSPSLWHSSSQAHFICCSTQTALLVHEASIVELMSPVRLWVDDNILVVFSVTLTLHKLLFGAAQSLGSAWQ